MKKAGKLIIPEEIRVCATCSFWDGERQVDPETRLVVVSESCVGECLLHGRTTHCTRPDDASRCAWEPLGDDDASAPESGSLPS